MARRRVRSAALFAVLFASGSYALVACGDSTFEGVPSNDGGGDDAAADGTSNDGANVGDDGGRFCVTRSPVPFFCADFDDSNIQNAFIGPTDTTFFGKPDATDGGSVALVPSGVDGSQALQAFLPSLSNVLPTVEFLAGALPALHASRATLQTQLRFDATDDVSSSTHVYLLTFELDGPSDKTQYALVGYAGKLHLDIGKNSVLQNSIDLGPPPAEAAGWVPFSIDVQIIGAGNAAATLGTLTRSSPAFVNETQQNAAIGFGLQSTGNSASFEVSFDDATIDVVAADGGLFGFDGG